MFDKGLEDSEMASREGVHELEVYRWSHSSRDERPNVFDYESFSEASIPIAGFEEAKVISFSDHLKEAASTAKIIPFIAAPPSTSAFRRARRSARRSKSTYNRQIDQKRGVNLAFENAYNHLVVVISITILSIALLVVIASSFGGVASSKVSYVVQPGDTIYSIASHFANGGSVSQLEYQLMQEVHGTTIVPGQTIAVG